MSSGDISPLSKRVLVWVASPPTISTRLSSFTWIKSILGEIRLDIPSSKILRMFLTYSMIFDRSRVVS